MIVSREVEDRFTAYEALVRTANQHQNLVSAASLENFRARHIEDSAQLLPLGTDGHWVDLGSGAGLPGIVLAILGARVTLIESRPLRSGFLRACIAHLGLDDRATLVAGRVESISCAPFDVITSRAFAPLPRLFATAFRLAAPSTVWVLPKGRSAASELASAAQAWHGAFRMVPSSTDPDASIIIASGVRPRKTT